MRARSCILILATLLLAPVLTGCGDVVVTDPDPVLPPDIGVFPDTPDRLIQNLRTAYESMDLVLLQRTLGPDHETVLQQSTQSRVPGVGPTLDRDQEIRVHERLFSKQAVVDPLGNQVAAIVGVQFQTWARQGVWEVSSSADPIPGTPSALYNVVVLWDRGQGVSMLKTQGQIRFYVTVRDSTVGGVTRQYYSLRGQRDLTIEEAAAMGADKAAVEYTAWGTIKAIFR